jgi:hypothetical protein
VGGFFPEQEPSGSGIQAQVIEPEKRSSAGRRIISRKRKTAKAQNNGGNGGEITSPTRLVL